MPPTPSKGRLTDKAALVKNETFTSRVSMGAVVVALNMMNEYEKNFAHPLRFSLATGVLSDPIAQGRRMAAVVLTNSTVADLATNPNPTSTTNNQLDEAIVDSLTENWNALAGVQEEIQFPGQ